MSPAARQPLPMTYVDASALASRFFRQPETDAAVAI
jgi:hypothetical protein